MIMMKKKNKMKLKMMKMDKEHCDLSIKSGDKSKVIVEVKEIIGILGKYENIILIVLKKWDSINWNKLYSHLKKKNYY